MKKVNRAIIGNGEVFINSGSRCVVIDVEQGKARPVLFAKHSGFIPDRKTFQIGELGDLVVSVHKDSVHACFFCLEEIVGINEEDQSPRYSVVQEPVKLPHDQSESLMKYAIKTQLKKKFEGGLQQFDKIIDFLFETTRGRQTSHLPDGVGWDDQVTIGDHNKIRRFREFFKIFVEQDLISSATIDEIIRDHVKLTASRLLTYKWEEAEKDFSKLHDLFAGNWNGLFFCRRPGHKWENRLAVITDELIAEVEQVVVVSTYCYTTAQGQPYGVKISLFSK